MFASGLGKEGAPQMNTDEHRSRQEGGPTASGAAQLRACPWKAVRAVSHSAHRSIFGSLMRSASEG